MYQNTPSRDSRKSLPAGILSGGDGFGRLMGNSRVVQQGVGIGNYSVCDPTSGECQDYAGDPGGTSATPAPPTPGVTSWGSAADIAALLKTTTADLLPFVVAQHPGVRMETRADGSIVVYNQATGTPGGFTSQGGSGAGGSVNANVGGANLSASGINMSTVVLVGGALLAVMLMTRGK